MNYNIIDVIVSPVLGTKGTIEFLMYIEKGNAVISAEQLTEKAINDYYKNLPEKIFEII